MKQALFLLATVLLFSQCKDRKGRDVQGTGMITIMDTAKVRLIDTVYNFGSVTDGDKVVYNYRFVNIGTTLLQVAKALPACGCTIAESPKDPVNPGDTGYIKIIFDSKSKAGDVHKSIKVISNAYLDFPDLQLTGKVLPPGQ